MTNWTIAELISHLKSLDVQVFIESDFNPFDEMRLRCTAPEGTLTPALRQELAERKAEIIFYLNQQRSQSIQPSITNQPATQGMLFPLSFAQQRLWFLYQLTPNNPFYNVPAAIRLTGTLNRTALERSFYEIVNRHAALRTTFTILDGQPVQVVSPDTKFELSVVNLQTVTASDRERISQQLATTEAQHPFNLTTDSLLRVTLLQFTPIEAVLLLTLHHIVADGWSLGVLIRELSFFYTAFVEGRIPILPPLPIQYSDFTCWQRNEMQGDILEKQLIYWRSKLQDLQVLHLPSDRPHPLVQTYRGATYPLQFSPTLTQALEAFSQQSGVSLFMTLLAAFQTLLYRYTGQEDIAIGSPIANRHRSELEGLIGFFVNSLVMRSNLSGNPNFRTFLEQVRETTLEAYEHQDLPFEKLVEELDPDRDLSRNPLFQVAFALQNAPMQPLELPGLMLEPAPLRSGSIRFDLEVHLWESAHGLRSLWQSPEGLSGFISYSTDLFDRDRISRLAGHFQTLLEGIVSDPDASLSDLPLLTATEHQQVFVEWNQTDSEQTNDHCFHHIFEAQVEHDPKAIALISEHRSLTYGELNQHANDLAQIPIQMGVQADTLVGLCVDRSADMVIGILGILKAGGAYVPIDPSYPSDRLHFMLTDTQVSILLTQSWLVKSLPESQATTVCLDQPLPLNLGLDKGVSSTPEHLAYVIYTSGSTGIPKGVLAQHKGLCNVVEAQRQVFHLSRSSRILQFSSLSFDASIFEIALALGSGGTLYLPPKPAQMPGIALVQFLEDNAITHALLTPAVLAVLPSAELPALQVLITGGEACSSQVVDRWAVNRHFFNAYGPTETTIWATIAKLYPGDHPLKIGRPILNTQIYILDTHLNPVPIGIPGELYIGGAGLARGYLNRPGLTAERFITTKRLALYKTSDRALFQADGTIEFLGRVDNQIKLRGFRVELGEIEATLQHHPAIQDAVVVASGESSETRLSAYFSLDRQHFQQTQLRSLQTQHIQHWQTLYNQTYQSFIPNPQFNITGWNSSYTGNPIPLEQMQEWVSDRVQQILALQPKRVLEIGCGSGLLLFQIASHCDEYWGTDFSEAALESIQQQLESLNLSQVKLFHRMATDFEGIVPEDMETAAFDVVILNSVVQYFPSQDYLMQVIEGAIKTVAPGGVLFLGDVRSLPLLRAFHTWVQFCQADASVERNQLRQQVERSLFEESELAIDPAFFHALRHKFPQIRQVQIRLSRGHSQNEMTQFRYNVLLHIEDQLTSINQPGSSSSDLIQKHSWKLNPITVETVKKNLLATEPEILIITSVTNSRVNNAVKAATWLLNGNAPKTVGRMRDRLENDVEMAIAPQEWWDLETVLPYAVEITWSTQTNAGNAYTGDAYTGDYDVLLIRHGVDASAALSVQQLCLDGNHYTNEPLLSQFARQLVPALGQHLGKTLPSYMIPSDFLPLENLPLTVSGKVDRRILSSFKQSLAHSPSLAIAPSTLTELTLTDIWKELLQIKQVNMNDNFFEMGGHSLLATQMTSRVRDAFGLELPLKNVFEAPTIAQLSPLIDTLRNTPLTLQAPPLVSLDRSVYRHKRSTLSTSNPQVIQDLSAPKSLANAQIVASNELGTGSRSPLVPLTLGGNKQPFFCVHPMFGVVFPYLELAQHLGNDRSFYGLQPLGLDGKSKPLNRIEAIAAYYIQAIQILQSQGPYFLGGWSFGGLVAFEMAQQLIHAGQEIALLAILDTPAPTHLQPSLYQTLKYLLGTALWSTLPFLLDYGAIATNRFHAWKPWLSRWQWSAIVRQLPEESQLQLLDESAIAPLLQIVYANSQAAYRYIPQKYSERITLFKAMEGSDFTGQNSTLGWNTLATNIQLHHVPGNHLSLLKQPHVQTLAQQIRPYLL
ncbi:MAG: amino acid adenylation domain-containing protein [Timaviella obliquedivisa GSE-PSE-MK23-08B]|jgi:amino acid adenylation domain-containing protein|nr:amino acid adenylation domain-containing protein [Timaviella obliquedivisa GSE-PSE-MK23-08B]